MANETTHLGALIRMDLRNMFSRNAVLAIGTILLVGTATSALTARNSYLLITVIVMGCTATMSWLLQINERLRLNYLYATLPVTRNSVVNAYFAATGVLLVGWAAVGSALGLLLNTGSAEISGPALMAIIVLATFLLNIPAWPLTLKIGIRAGSLVPFSFILAAMLIGLPAGDWLAANVLPLVQTNPRLSVTLVVLLAVAAVVGRQLSGSTPDRTTDPPHLDQERTTSPCWHTAVMGYASESNRTR